MLDITNACTVLDALFKTIISLNDKELEDFLWRHYFAIKYKFIANPNPD
jgi:hypothetical protein